MAFPTLFPIGISMIAQTRLRKVDIQEYSFHLMCYYDNYFGQHPRFRCYFYSLMLRHRSQETTAIFVKRNLEVGLPMAVAYLCACLHDVLDSILPDQIMCFGSGLRGTHTFWNKCKCEVTNIITQIGSPTFFFTLSAVDTKWHDLHMVMPAGPPPRFIRVVSMEIPQYNQESTSYITIHSLSIHNIPRSGLAKRFPCNKLLV